MPQGLSSTDVVSEAEEADADSETASSLQLTDREASSAEKSSYGHARWVPSPLSNPSSDVEVSGPALAEEYDVGFGFGDACLAGGSVNRDDEDDFDGIAAARPSRARQWGSDLLHDLCTSASFRGLKGGEGMSMHNLCSWLEVAGTGLKPEHGRRAMSFSTATTSTGRTPGRRTMRSPSFKSEMPLEHSSPTTSRRAPTAAVAAAPISVPIPFHNIVNLSRTTSTASTEFLQPLAAPASGLSSNGLSSTQIAASAMPLQPKLLRTMLGFKSPATLLHWISANLSVLDSINLVSALYRIARMFTDVRDSGEREALKQQLLQSSALQLLLRTILGHVLAMSRAPQAELEIRTLVNLVWSVVKLELANDPFSLGFELLHSSAPRVILLLPGCSAQGVGNLLWAYSKLEKQPEKVMLALVVHITDTLVANPAALDAQALSNSVWALAHNECKLALSIDEDSHTTAHTYGQKTRNFLNATANGANELLHKLRAHRTSNGCAAVLAQAEHQFSGQALSNIAWSIATLLSDSIDSLPCLAFLMHNIKREALIRLRATTAALNEGTWLYKLPGGMNEQALSNLAFAFNKTGLLDADLLNALLCVGEQHLLRPDRSKPAFKPSQLTQLLQVAMSPLAKPQPFLKAVATVLNRHAQLFRYWTTSELQDLESALLLLQPSPPARTPAFPSQPSTPQRPRQQEQQQPQKQPPQHLSNVLSHRSAAGQHLAQNGKPYPDCMPTNKPVPSDTFWSLDGLPTNSMPTHSLRANGVPTHNIAAHGMSAQSMPMHSLVTMSPYGMPQQQQQQPQQAHLQQQQVHLQQQQGNASAAACMQQQMSLGGYGPLPLPMVQPQMMFPVVWQVPSPWQMAPARAPYMTQPQSMPCPSLRYDQPPGMVPQYLPPGLMWGPPQLQAAGCPGFPFWAAQ
ncbi:MAG: hypothetical protein WDW38_005480 [Sanguina aurantia]